MKAVKANYSTSSKPRAAVVESFVVALFWNSTGFDRQLYRRSFLETR